MPNRVKPGSGSYKLTGTHGESQGKSMYVEIDGDVLTAFHRKYDWTDPPKAFVSRSSSSDIIAFFDDDSGVASIDQGNGIEGHSFGYEASP